MRHLPCVKMRYHLWSSTSKVSDRLTLCFLSQQTKLNFGRFLSPPPSRWSLIFCFIFNTVPCQTLEFPVLFLKQCSSASFMQPKGTTKCPASLLFWSLLRKSEEAMILFSRGDLPTKQSICTVLVVISLTRGLPEQYFRLGFHSTKHARQQNQAGVFPLAVS